MSDTVRFQPADKVRVKSGHTVWTVLETYRGERDTNLVLADGHRRQVAEARFCKAA